MGKKANLADVFGSHTDSFAFGAKEEAAWKKDGQYTDSFAVDKKERSLQAVFEAPEVKQEYDPKAAPVIDNIDLSICADEERPRMVALINRLAKSEAGKETLDIAVKAGYKFGFLDASSGDAGTCFGTVHAIGLNPVVSDDKLISTLCHEARHAGQKDRMKYIPDRDLLDVASGVRRARAEEADAEAYAALACKQLELQGDKAPMAAFAESDLGKETYAAFEKSLSEQNGVLNDKVVADAFKGWYSHNGLQGAVKQLYEEAYILQPMRDGVKKFEKGQTEGVYPFNEKMSSKEVIEQIGWTGKGNYLAGEDPDFLDKGLFISISERTKQDANIFFRIRKEKTGIEKDTSIDAMPTYKDVFPRMYPEMEEKPVIKQDEKAKPMSEKERQAKDAEKAETEENEKALTNGKKLSFEKWDRILAAKRLEKLRQY